MILSKISTENSIISTLKKYYPEDDLIFSYWAGSFLYNCSNINSDLDVVAVFANRKSLKKTRKHGIDFYIFGAEILKDNYLHKKHPFINKCHYDAVLYLKDQKKIIYRDPIYQNEILNYLSIDFNSFLIPYLRSVVSYHKYLLNHYHPPIKYHYHLIRVRGLLDQYDKTGNLGHIIDGKYQKEIINYRNACKNGNSMQFVHQLKSYLSYIQIFLGKC
jgi:hypothetical protein